MSETPADIVRYREDLADRVRRECGSRNWSVQELIRRTGISRNRAYDCYQGRKPYTFDDLLLVARALDVSVSVLLGELGSDSAVSDEDTFAQVPAVAA